MPVPAHVRINVNGTLRGGEVFSFGFDMLGEAGNQATLQSMVDDVADFVQGDNASGLRAFCSVSDHFTAVRGYSYALGATAADLVAESTFSITGGGQSYCPLQVAVCVTTLTGVAGRRHRGRMYLPGTGLSLTNQALIPDADCDAAATSCAALLHAAGSALTPVVISRVGQSAMPITSVRIDNRADVIRNRASKQAATHQATHAV